MNQDIESLRLTKEERDEIFDALPSTATAGDERKALCDAQIKKVLDKGYVKLADNQELPWKCQHCPTGTNTLARRDSKGYVWKKVKDEKD